MAETISIYHSNPDIRRQASCETLRQGDYIKMALEPEKGQNKINKDILNRCNKLYKQYLLQMKEIEECQQTFQRL